MMKVAGKVAVIVGAAREGIGKAYCRALLDKGAKLCFADILEEEGRKTEKEFKEKYGPDNVTFVPCDVRKQEDIENVFSRAKAQFGRIDIGSYNCAVINEFDFTLPIDVNIAGLIRYTNCALGHMSKVNGGQGGVIVHTGSTGSLYPSGWGPVYIATKHAVLGYTRSMACEENFSLHGVRFNLICPGCVATHFVDFLRPDCVLHADAKVQANQLIEHVPLSLLGEWFIRLVEDEAMNGQAVEVEATKSRMVPYYKPDF